MQLLGIAIGGALGTLLRYYLGKFITFNNFPIATLCINTIGSLLLGFFFIKYAQQNNFLYLIFGIGFCGGFTTYSTFSLDLYKMIIASQYIQFTMYFIATTLLSLIGVFVGVYLAKNQLL